MMNPFSFRHPVEPKYFANRKEILETFKRALLSSAKTTPRKPENIAILGGWGYGKTSILRKFEEIALEESDLNVFSVFIELSPATCKDFRNFMIRTRDEIDRNFETKTSLFPKIKKEVSRWKVNTLSFGLRLERTDEKSDVTVLENALIDLWKNVLEPNKVDVALLMFDDLHYLVKHYKEGLYDLRAIFQQLAMKGCNYMVFASGPENMFKDIRELAEPLSRFFNRYKLKTFGLEETKFAILQPIKAEKLRINIEDTVIEKIFKLTRGHPSFIHFIMHDLIDFVGKGKITDALFEKNWPQIMAHLERDKFEDDFDAASEDEKQILLKIAAQNEDVASPSQLKSKKWVLFRRLEEKGLIHRHERGTYSLYHPLFKGYLRKLKHA